MNSRVFGVGLISLLLYSVRSSDGATTTTIRPRSTTVRIGNSNISTTLNPTTRTTVTSTRNNRLCEDDQKFYFNETKKCYFPTNSFAVSFYDFKDIENPCGELQRFYIAQEPYGACDCVRDEDGCGTRELFDRPVLNWPGNKRCYYAYEQGPCKTGEWIVMNPKTFQSECKPNPCQGRKLQAPLRPPNKPSVEVFWFMKGDTCYQTFTKAFCKEGQYAQFLGTSLFPKCLETQYGKSCGYGSGTTASLPCAQGLKKLGDACVPEVEID